MSENNIDMRIGLGVTVHKTEIDKAARDISEGIIKGIGNNGYVKLGAEIIDYKYPKQTMTKSGIRQGTDYSKLQKAQDKLISKWNKLSDKGFSSHDKEIVGVLKSFRDYQLAVKDHYKGTKHKDTDDPQVMAIRREIGGQLHKYFTRLLSVNLEGGKKGSIMDILNNAEFERQALRVVQRHRGASRAGVDLSKSALTKKDRVLIDAGEQIVNRDATRDKALAEREYAKKHAKEIQKEEQKQLEKIQKDREARTKNAVKLPKSTTPPEEVQLSETEVVDLAQPTDYKQTKKDKRKDKKFTEDLSKESYTRQNNTSGHDMSLGVRRQVWSPTYVNEDFLRKMERGGTYTDTNALLRQIFKELPGEIRRAMKELTTSIDKDAAMQAFNKFDKSEKKQWSDMANELGMRKLLLTNVAKVQNALMAGRPDVTPEDLKNAIAVAIADATEHGKSQIAAENYKKAVLSIGNMLMSRYDTMKDAIGSNVRVHHEGRPDDPEIGVGPNYEVVATTLKDVFKDLQKHVDIMMSRAVKEFPEFYGGKTSKTTKKDKTSTFEQVFATKLANLEQLTATMLDYSITDSASESISDAKLVKGSRTAIDVARANDTTGFDSDENASTLIGQQNTANRLSGEIKDTLHEIFSMLGDAIRLKSEDGNNNGNGGNKPPLLGGMSQFDNEDEQAHYVSILTQISKTLSNIDINVGNILQSVIHETDYMPTNALALVPGQEAKTHIPKRNVPEDRTDYSKISQKHQERLAEEEIKQLEQSYRKAAIKKALKEREAKHEQIRLDKEAEKQAKGRIASQIDMSEVITSTPGIFGKLQDSLRGLLPSTAKVDEIMRMNKDERMKARAQRMELYGENMGRNLTDTGDKARVKRTKSLFGWVYKNDEKNKELFQNVRLTKGFNRENRIDTTAILGEMRKVLSGPEMFKAQTGGVLRNIIGSMTGYIGMPSLEKSRAEAEGLNQIMANVRKEITTLVQSIQAKEMTLKGMEDAGTAKFTDKGVITDDSSTMAKKTFVDLEEQKGVLAEALAEVKMIDQVIGVSGGKVRKILKQLAFVMPELMEQNTIIQNINAGLDKNGKALKFQSRTAEVLNYSLQLMSRHVGQIAKNWMMQLNPLVQIKKLFNDFANYNVKWQRTMNVIKYNLRAIFVTLMDDIAQTLVNIIGFFDIILMKIQEAFGKTPISLFDQSAADAEKMKEQLEEAQNVSAGFDELHDISGDSGSGGAAENLFGEIYKPELSPEWKELAEKIGDLFKGIITGDMGFGEVMQNILEILVEGLKLIGETIWEWLKGSTIGQYLQKQWKSILDTLLKIFIGWELLKIAGRLLYDALFKFLTGGAFKSVLAKLGTGISAAFAKIPFGTAILNGITSFIGGLGLGIKAAINGIGLLDTLKIAFTNPEAVAAMGGWGRMLGVIFSQAFGVALGVGTIAKGFDMNADAGAYNIGLREAGGDKDDEKSYAGGNVLGAVGGGLLGMFLVGGPLAIGIGAIAGLVTTSLAPAFEKAAVGLRNANNEMQKLEYYQGIVQGYSTEVGKLSEMQRLLSETLRLNTEKVVEEGIQLGHTEERMRELTTAVVNGTFNTDMLTTSEQNLKDMLVNLDAQQEKNRVATEKLEAAKRKLEKAELDLAIAEDVAAGNFELAAARIEYAMAAEVYTTDEATQKMIQIVKEGSDEQAEAILRDLSPEMAENFLNYRALTTKEAKELYNIWDDLSEDTKQSILDSVGPDTQSKFASYIDNIDENIRDHISTWDKMCDTIKEIFSLGSAVTRTYNTAEYNSKNGGGGFRSVTVPSMAVGTNYVPNDGLVYLHQGEAVIPKKYNQPYSPGLSGEEAAYMQQMISTMKSLDGTIKQGISVNGQFVQRGSDLVAVVNKTKSQTGADLLSNVSYAR